VHVVRRRHSKLCFGFDAEQSAVQAAQVLTEAASSYKHLRVFRYAREVDIRAVPFTKGLAVSELASHLAIPSACILAIGNGHNDISMLDGAVAGMTGCPANSEPEVVEAVSRNGGHVAKERSLTGVLEILSAYAEDKVSSALPADWVSSSETENPNRQRHARGSSRRHRTRLVILIGAAYAVFLVLLHFEILPFGRLLMKPFERAVSLLAVAYERVVTWLF
jgi:3-deoxy-D-manno-octulosonate 8-phosphate phosphatase KdsC-like HAD superfamily phosphatase